jgi:hypothetical protein
MAYGNYRALYTTAFDRLFAVIGSGLYEIFDDKSSLLRGNINTSSGRCSISENETQLLIVDGIDAWIYTIATNLLTKVVSEGIVSASHSVVLDGFFVINETNTGRFHWSNLRDGNTWDALNFSTAEGSPDNLVSMGKINNELWLFGKKTTEIWYDTGNADSQFQRGNSGFLDVGCAAQWSVATMGNTILWLGSSLQGNGIVWSASSYIPQRISTHAIEYIIGQIAKTSTLEDAEAYCYQEEGHFFYVLTFPSGNRTLVYDMKTQIWHERGYWNSVTGTMGRHRGSCHVFWRGKNYVSDYQNTNLYELDLDTYTDNGDVIRRVRTGPHIRQDRKRLYFHTFELDVERGVGLSSGQGNMPKLNLLISNDGGRTFGNNIPLSIGKTGEYTVRAIARRLGMSRDRVNRVWTDDPVKIVLIGARADVEIEGV